MAACALTVALATGALAQTQTAQAPAPGGQPGDPALPSPLPPRTLGDIPGLAKALERPFIHSLRIDIDQSYSKARAKDFREPDKRTSRQTVVSTSFAAGDRFFGQAGISLDKTEGVATNSPQNGSLRYDSDSDTRALFLNAGYFVLPDVALGANYADNSSSGFYQPFMGAPADTDTEGHSWGVFATWRLPVETVALSLNTAWNKSTSNTNYTNNFPPSDSGWTEIWTTTLSAAYPLDPAWRVMGSASWSRVFGQKQHEFDPGLDKEWFTLTAGLGWRMNENIEWRLQAATWAGNERTDYRQVTFGFGYLF